MKWGNFHILSPKDLSCIEKKLFVSLRAKEDILSNLSLQEDMQTWILHHIAEAKNQNKAFVDIKIWPETARHPLWHCNDWLISWIQSEGYSVVINKEKTHNTVVPFVREVFVSVSWE